MAKFFILIAQVKTTLYLETFYKKLLCTISDLIVFQKLQNAEHKSFYNNLINPSYLLVSST